MKDWQITKEGKYIVVKQLVGQDYQPTMFFDGLMPFHNWAVQIANSCKSLGDLADEIEHIYRETFMDTPKGQIADYVNSLEKIDGIK